VAAGIAVMTAALFAAYLPARQASRTDPAAVLRSE
jgi:ABC-type lipoprotein release transport system permease subunit